MVFGSLEGYDILRSALDALRLFHGVRNSHDATEQNVLYNRYGEMLRDAGFGSSGGVGAAVSGVVRQPDRV
jgi:hypothetical protein